MIRSVNVYVAVMAEIIIHLKFELSFHRIQWTEACHDLADAQTDL